MNKKEEIERLIQFVFPDKSSWIMSEEIWIRALENKLEIGNLNFKKFYQIFIENVEDYWKRKKVLTKFGDEDWGVSYKSMGELASDMMYGYIRASLMGLILAEASEEKGGRVMAIQGNGSVVQYGKKARKFSGVNKAIESCRTKKKPKKSK